jgi:hypothetical protein
MVTLRSRRQCLFVSSWPPTTGFAPLPASPTRWILVAWLVPALDADTPTAALTTRAAAIAIPNTRHRLLTITHPSYEEVRRTLGAASVSNKIDREK